MVPIPARSKRRVVPGGLGVAQYISKGVDVGVVELLYGGLDVVVADLGAGSAHGLRCLRTALPPGGVLPPPCPAGSR